MLELPRFSYITLYILFTNALVKKHNKSLSSISMDDGSAQCFILVLFWALN